MKFSKKVLVIFTVIAVVFSSLAVCTNAYAKTLNISLLDYTYSANIDGAGDLIWYTYTPEASGTYSFLSYNVPASHAYLFTRDTSDSGGYVYTQLAYSKSDDNYEANDHNEVQFCLTYYLVKGVTYYYAAGWLFESRTSGIFNVMLRCDEYDDVQIDYITAVLYVTSLAVNNNGSWQTDTNGDTYYYYNIDRLIANTSVTIHYTDGTTSTSSSGASSLDDYTILYTHTQSENHWYPTDDYRYESNDFVVKILDFTATLEVVIDASSASFSFNMKVIDMTTGEYVNGAVAYYNGIPVDESDTYGNISFYLPLGINTVTIKESNSVSRTIDISIVSCSTYNNFTSDKVSIVTCDYVDDEVINAKDYAYIIKSMDSSEQSDAKAKFSGFINFTSDDYEEKLLTNQ